MIKGGLAGAGRGAAAAQQRVVGPRRRRAPRSPARAGLGQLEARARGAGAVSLHLSADGQREAELGPQEADR